MRRGCVGARQEGKITRRVKKPLQTEIGHPFRGDSHPLSLQDEYDGDEYQARAAADPHCLELANQWRGSLPREYEGGVSETGTERNQHRGPIALALRTVGIRYGAASDDDATYDDAGHGRPLHECSAAHP